MAIGTLLRAFPRAQALRASISHSPPSRSRRPRSRYLLPLGSAVTFGAERFRYPRRLRRFDLSAAAGYTAWPGFVTWPCSRSPGRSCVPDRPRARRRARQGRGAGATASTSRGTAMAFALSLLRRRGRALYCSVLRPSCRRRAGYAVDPPEGDDRRRRPRLAGRVRARRGAAGVPAPGDPRVQQQEIVFSTLLLASSSRRVSSTSSAAAPRLGGAASRPMSILSVASVGVVDGPLRAQRRLRGRRARRWSA